MQLPYTLVLASASPRRDEILTNAGLPHVVRVSGADERQIPYILGEPAAYATAVAVCKGKAVPAGTEEVVLAADTVVYEPSSRALFGKPRDRDDAIRMLTALSGREHAVITGVYLQDAYGWEKQFAVTSRIRFHALTRTEIEQYVDSASPYDKAGAYGIQEGACLFVKEILGDYYSIMGLPVSHVYRALLERPALQKNAFPMEN